MIIYDNINNIISKCSYHLFIYLKKCNNIVKHKKVENIGLKLIPANIKR